MTYILCEGQRIYSLLFFYFILFYLLIVYFYQKLPRATKKNNTEFVKELVYLSGDIHSKKKKNSKQYFKNK